MTLRRSQNPRWKGGRTISSHGYILIKVDEPEHQHLVQKNLYAYEHQVIMEKKLGRKLIPGEIVHHINGDKQDNRPENLDLRANHAEHHFEHRHVGSTLREPKEPNKTILCACGCSGKLMYYDNLGRPRTYVSGHNPQPSPTKNGIIDVLQRGSAHRAYIARQCGISLQSTATALSKMKRNDLVYQISRGVWGLKNHG